MAIALHPKTHLAVDNYLKQPAHALAIIAPRGSGKTYLAKHITARLLVVEPVQVENHQYVKVVTPDEKLSIKIEHAKEVVRFLRLKTTGDNAIRRVIIIEHGETMTLDAQNMLLKLLEEPPADTVIVITVSDRTAMLSTIMSRVQTLTVYNPAEQELRSAFKGTPSAVLDNAYKLSGGKPGLMKALVDNDTDHPLIAAIEEVKTLLAGDQFTRLLAVDEITKNKRSMLIVQALSFMAETTINLMSQKADSHAGIQKWTTILMHSNEAEEQLRRNGQAKMVLTNLFIHIY